MKKIYLLLLSLLSGLLLAISWPVFGFSGFIFFAFIPFLIVEIEISKRKDQFSKFAVFFYSYPGFLLWNIATTYWVWYSTPAAIVAWSLNALFMSMVFSLFSYVRRNFHKPLKAYFILPGFWIAFEYLHLNWNITWPWLTLGNVFSNHTGWIQWYEYTGFLGGSLWVFIVNILLFKIIYHFIYKSNDKRTLYINSIALLSAILLPLFLSSYLYQQEIPINSKLKVILTQPNLDPYSRQYSTSPSEVVEDIIQQSNSLLDNSPSLLLAPESVLQDRIKMDNLKGSKSINRLQLYTKNNPNLSILVGASTSLIYNPDIDILPSSVRYSKRSDIYYDVFNTAFLIENNKIQYHHKSKLTPGVEYMPTSGIFKILNNFAIDLGGAVGSLGKSTNVHALTMKNKIKIAPVICYESIFGDYVSQFTKEGAQLICIITNDGWWGDSPGYKQHFEYAKLRAIENRKYVVRSANTGITGFINAKGEVLEKTPYWVKEVISKEVNLNSIITFYAQWGDYLGRIAAFFSILLLLLEFVRLLKKKKL